MGGRRERIDLGDASNKRQKNNDVNPWTGMPFSQRYYSILEKRYNLPVYQFKKELVEKVLENQCVVVEGETGMTLYSIHCSSTSKKLCLIILLLADRIRKNHTDSSIST
jgi:hypothetical protein